MVAWNALLFAAGLTLIVAAAEVWFQWTLPFLTSSVPAHFVPKIGPMLKSNAEIRRTNVLDFWTVSRTNSLGFLDREPVSPARAAASCHIAVIGDSFVEAMQLPIADKFQVRLEELAARELPHLDITTSAFGNSGTGQIHQLPYYDEFARRLHPKLLVLVFARGDFADNSPVLDWLAVGRNPDHFPHVSAKRDADETIKLHPPDPDWWKYRFPQLPPSPKSWYARAMDRVTRMSYLAAWLDAKRSALFPAKTDPALIARAELLSRRPGYEELFDGWRTTARWRIDAMFAQKNLLPVIKDALDFTTFALEQFKERAERDGVSLVILASHGVKLFKLSRGNKYFDQMNAVAEALGIPVIDQYDHILRQDAEPRDAQWAHNGHWNAAGHRWAAEALLEYLKQRPEICDGPVAKRTPDTLP